MSEDSPALTEFQLLTVIKDVLGSIDESTIIEMPESACGTPADPAHRVSQIGVLLEILGVPASFSYHASIDLGMLFAAEGKYVPRGKVVECLRNLSNSFNRGIAETDQMALFQAKVTRFLVEYGGSIACVDSFDERTPARDRRMYLETGPIVKKWPREILTDRRWNTIESPIPGNKALPLTETWVRLRIKAIENIRVAAHPIRTPLYLNEESEEEMAGSHLEDLLYQIRSLTCIIGQPGAGKTTIVKWVARFLVTDRLCPFLIPIVISLREYALERAKRSELKLLDYFLEQRGISDPDQRDRWRRLAYPVPLIAGEELPNREGFFWLLDGWDEVPMGMRELLLNDLRAIQEMPGIVTTRHSATPFVLPVDEFYEIAPLTSYAQSELIESWLLEMGRPDAVYPMLEKLAGSSDFRKIARSPFLLTLICSFATSGDSGQELAFPENRAELYKDTIERIADYHTKMRPDSPFESNRIRQLERLASWLSFEAPEAPRFVFEPGDVVRATGDEEMFDSVLEPSRMVCATSPAKRHFQFIHTTFQEYLTAQHCCEDDAVFRTYLEGRILTDPSVSEIAQFAIASGGHSFKQSVWETVRRGLGHQDDYGVMAARASQLLAVAGVGDGGEALLGQDLRPLLWRLIYDYHKQHPQLLIDSLLELDQAYFAERLFEEIHEPRRLYLLQTLPEQLLDSLLEEPKYKNVFDQRSDFEGSEIFSVEVDKSLAAKDFDLFKPAFIDYMLRPEDAKEHLILHAQEFGKNVVPLLVEALLNPRMDDVTRGFLAEGLMAIGTRRSSDAVMSLLASCDDLEAPLAYTLLGIIQGYLLTEAESKLVFDFLRQSPDADIRETCAHLLESSRLQTAPDLLLKAFNVEGDADVRLAILESLRELASDRVISDVQEIFSISLARGDEEIEIAAAAFSVLLHTLSSNRLRARLTTVRQLILQTARESLIQKDHPLALTTATHAAEFGTELVQELSDALLESRHPVKVLIEICYAFQKIRSPKAIEALATVAGKAVERFENEYWSLQDTAALALGWVAPERLAAIDGEANDQARAKVAFVDEVLFLEGRVLETVVAEPRPTAMLVPMAIRETLEDSHSFLKEELGQLRDALVHAFDEKELAQLVYFEMGERLDVHVEAGSLSNRTFGLIQWAEREGRLLELVSAVCGRKPNNPKVKAFLPDVAARLTKTHLQGSASGESVPSSGGYLEAMVWSGGIGPPGIQFTEFLSGLNRAAAPVCRVDTGNSLGTGFLVGPDLLMTNAHVITKETDLELVSCDFEIGSATSRVLKELERSESSELDYVILSLKEHRGTDNLEGGAARGWLKPKTDSLRKDQPIHIVQHPSGGGMRIASGILSDFNSHRKSMAYTAETLGGSSGSPCFDQDWSWVGLHHHGEGGIGNHGIPVSALVGASSVLRH